MCGVMLFSDNTGAAVCVRAFLWMSCAAAPAPAVPGHHEAEQCQANPEPRLCPRGSGGCTAPGHAGTSPALGMGQKEQLWAQGNAVAYGNGI